MDQRYADLAAAIARQALTDAARGYTSRRHMDARQWLRLAGLMRDDGTTRSGAALKPPGRNRARTSPDEYNRRRRVERAEQRRRRDLQEA